MRAPPKLSRYGTFNSWDALKLLALLFMFIDHAGYFFFPEASTLRALGRGAAPIFLFLTGYAPAHRIKPDLIAMAALMWAVNLFAGGGFVPLNILGTILVGRVITTLLDKGALKLRKPYEWMLMLTVLILPSGLLLMPGTLGLMFVLLGYMQRRADVYDAKVRLHCMVFAFALEYGWDLLGFPMGLINRLLMAAVLAGVAALLWHVRLQPVAAPAPIEPALRLTARYSLWIYALHFVVLQLITGKHY